MTDGVRHFLLDPRAGFRPEPALSDAVEWGRRGIALRPLPGSPQPVTDPGGSFGGVSEPLGVAVGGDGTTVILDHAGSRVLRLDGCAHGFAPLPCLGRDGDACAGIGLSTAHGLAVTRPGDVVIADTGNRRVLVLVGAGLAVRRIIGPRRIDQGRMCEVAASLVADTAGDCPATIDWPAGTWEPWAVTATSNGFVVTDRTGGLVHFFDPCGRWLAASDGSDEHGSVPPLVRPTAIAADRGDNLYVLQEGIDRVRVLDRSGTFVADVETLDDRRACFCPISVAIGPRGELCVAMPDGGLCVLVRPTDTGEWQPLGTSHVGDEIRGLAFDRDGNALTCDPERGCLVRLRDGAGYPRTGRFITTALDSGLADCQWHRVAFTGSIPSGTSILIETLTADALLTPAELSAVPAERWETHQLASTTDDGRWDCLIQSAPGRYLWLALTLRGDGAVTPSVEDVELWFPRHTSADLLPRAFRTDPESADFLERFQSIFDAARSTVTSPLDRIAELFDPLAVPADPAGQDDFLGWLAGWVGMSVEERIPVERRRRLVREAADLYRVRGTPEGVRRHVSLVCGIEVRVLEYFKVRRWAIANRGRLGDATQLFGPGIVRRLQLDEFSDIGEFRLIDTDDPLRDPFHISAHRFALILLANDDDQLLAQAIRVAEAAKPAHTEVDVRFAAPRLQIGAQSTIGFDTVVGAVPPPGRTGEGRLGRGLVVAGNPAFGDRHLAQVGVKARIGIDAGLE